MEDVIYLSIISILARLASSDVFEERPSNPFTLSKGLHGVQRKTAVNSSRSKSRTHFEVNEELSATNSWGFDDEAMKIAEIVKPSTRAIITSTLNYELIDPNRNGLLKDIGSINVGFGVGVGVPGNDPVRVGTKVGVAFGESGLAGQLPIGQDIFPRQGQWQSLNDYDGDKTNIVADRAQKYWLAVMEGRVRTPHNPPSSSIVHVGRRIGVDSAR